MNFTKQFHATLGNPDSMQNSNTSTFSPNLLIQDHIENSDHSTSLVLNPENDMKAKIIDDNATNRLNLFNENSISEDVKTENCSEKEYLSSSSSTIETKQFPKESSDCFCHKCLKTFNHHKNLIKHKTICKGKSSSNGGIKCPQCAHLFTRNDSLQDHVVKDHGLQLEKENIYFLNYNGRCSKVFIMKNYF